MWIFFISKKKSIGNFLKRMYKEDLICHYLQDLYV